jgi:hypothetical protein
MPVDKEDLKVPVPTLTKIINRAAAIRKLTKDENSFHTEDSNNKDENHNELEIPDKEGYNNTQRNKQ